MRGRALALAALFALTLIAPVHAVQPDEILADPALEARARAISQNLRCLVCRNENIDDSDADLARDLRILLRERLTAGDTDAQAVAFLVDRYGEYVLLKPTAQGANLILWLAGPAMLALGLGIAFVGFRRRTGALPTPEGSLAGAVPGQWTGALPPTPDALSEVERSRLDELMRE